MAQAGSVANRLRAVDPELEVELVVIESTGDRDRTSPVAALTEMGAFVRSIQTAVLDGRADLAVHSLKDLPTDRPSGLAIAAYPNREPAHDVMVGAPLDRLAEGAVVGTGSPRRIAQLRVLRPDLSTVELRGNVPTRLRRVEQGDVDAAILAEAGLLRLGLHDAIQQRLTLADMVPAPGQGILAVETLEEGSAFETARRIDDPHVRRAAETERLLLTATGAGCRSALGALASQDGDLVLTAFVADDRGPRRATVSGTSSSQVVSKMMEELGL
jgi:hydroxymethylbilane synthase